MTLPCFGDQKGEQSILLMTRRTSDCLGSLSATLLGLFFFVVLKNIHLRRILTIQRWNCETLQHKYAHDLYERMKPKEKRMVQPRIIHLAIKCCVNTTNMEDMQSIC